MKKIRKRGVAVPGNYSKVLKEMDMKLQLKRNSKREMASKTRE